MIRVRAAIALTIMPVFLGLMLTAVFLGWITEMLLAYEYDEPPCVISERDAHAIAKEMVTEELVLPGQLSRGHRHDSLLSGEKALMLAVLEDGIRCFQGHLQAPRIHPRRLERDATAWIESTDDTATFSFVSICEHLGLSASALRTRLLSQKATRVDGTADAPKFYRLHLRVRRRKGT